jgi:cell division transport system ATP-binding protein
MIVFHKISKKFKDGTLVLNEISFSIDKGEFVFLVGPSGAGKTTISRLLLREILPSRGRIFVDNEEITKLKKGDIPRLRRKIGTAFQDFKLLLDRTVFENIALSLEIIQRKDVNIKERVARILSLVGLQGKEDFFPLQLSGGELQRVVIGRALAHSPKILFADEPTGNLDQETAWQIIDLLKRINDEGTTVLVATHNADIVNTLSQRVIRLEKGEIKKDEKEGKYREKSHPPAGGKDKKLKMEKKEEEEKPTEKKSNPETLKKQKPLKEKKSQPSEKKAKKEVKKE